MRVGCAMEIDQQLSTAASFLVSTSNDQSMLSRTARTPPGARDLASQVAGRRLFSLTPCGVRGERSSLLRSGAGSTGTNSKVHKPHLNEMHGSESLPYRPGRAAPRKPSPDDIGAGSGSKIFQPTDSRQSGPEFGPTPRSTGGAPGHRGGWKKR